MRTPSHGSALDRGGIGVVGVNFNNPTKAVRFIGVLSCIKTGIVLVPTVANAAFAQTPALFVIAEFVAAIEVENEVFFGGEVCAPRCDATGAIVQSAQNLAS